MKKAISLCAAALLLLSVLSGCGGNTEVPATDDKPTVICTVFPQYDWTRKIVGYSNGVDVKLLVSNGVDMHSFQPSTADMVALSDCDMLVYVGGESDTWVDDALKNASNKDMITVNMMDILGGALKEEEIVEGMEAEEHDHDHDHEHEHEDEEAPEYDEHVWLSLKNAAVLCSAISDALSEIDAENADTYAANAERYIGELNALHDEYLDAVSGAELKTLIFADRFPFRYLTDDCGLEYFAAFAGCSADTEASFETVIFLADKVDELNAPAICIIDGSDGKIAETVASNTANPDIPILTLDSMQSVTSEDISGGCTYLGIMHENLSTIKTALGV